MNPLLDLYTDYLLASTGPTTATGLSTLVQGAVSHDEVTRLLNGANYSPKDLWALVKPVVRSQADGPGVLIFDDTISEKPYTDENTLVNYHFDHAKGRSVRGINLLTGFYHQASESPSASALCLPVYYQVTTKTEAYTDAKTGRVRYKSALTKNQHLRAMVDTCLANQVPFACVVGDAWFGASDNLLHIARAGKAFIFELKTNRLAACSEADRQRGHWTRIDALNLPEHTPTPLYLKDLDLQVVVLRQVFKNENSSGVRYLVSNALTWSDEQIATTYQKRCGRRAGAWRSTTKASSRTPR